MSASGIAASSIFQLLQSYQFITIQFPKFPNRIPTTRPGPLVRQSPQAQSDFASLEAPTPTSSTHTQTTPLASTMAQLCQDLQSGNL